jgi:hypothetical protein
LISIGRQAKPPAMQKSAMMGTKNRIGTAVTLAARER